MLKTKSFLKYFCQNGVLPGGIKISVGNTLKLKNVTQKQAGTYVCVAENGVSKTVTNKIIIIVDESDDIFVKRGGEF